MEAIKARLEAMLKVAIGAANNRVEQGLMFTYQFEAGKAEGLRMALQTIINYEKEQSDGKAEEDPVRS